MMDVKTMEARQRKAYENRDSILPGDRLLIQVSGVTDDAVELKMKYSSLWIDQTKKDPLKPGQTLTLYCYEQRIARNGLGLFVDYQFALEDLGVVIINGPDAQRLQKLGSAYLAQKG